MALEIEINHTPATNDDIVGGNETTSCRLRLVGADQGIGATVTLSAADVPGKGLVDFQWVNEPPLYLNSDGTWQYVMITGVRGSAAINDARINIHRERFSYEGSPIFPDTHKDATVFWFDAPGIEAIPEGEYGLRSQGNNTVFTPPLGPPPIPAITVKATVTLMPIGLDPSAPQIAKYKFGIQQNIDGGWVTDVTYGPPTVYNPDQQWRPGAVSGRTYNIPAYTFTVAGLGGAANDSEEGSFFPFYDAPVSLLGTGPTLTEIKDAPNVAFPLPGFVGFTYSEGGVEIIDVLYYSISSARFNESFKDWAVLATYNPDLGSRRNLAETSWSLNLDTSNPQLGLLAIAGPEYVPPQNSPVDRPLPQDNTTTVQGFDQGGPTWPYIAP